MERSNGRNQIHRRRPSLQQLVDLSQIVGALGIIISLLVLAGEVRQNTRALRSGTFQALTGLSAELRLFVAEHSGSARWIGRGALMPDSLSEAEWAQWDAYVAATMRQFENVHYAYRSGTLDPEVWSGYDNNIRSVAHLPGFSRWYRARPHLFSQSFQVYMADVLRSPPPSHPRLAPAL